ncbi:unnamed protein product [Phytomonas sp. Hart1]|nr:unnamed protein product [Phytomonas sp. Hart1]|eukprot:CCW72229.1 unnamed protein product [Phytomonas sp. isolate Hart1]
MPTDPHGVPPPSQEDEELCAMFSNLIAGGLTTAEDLASVGFTHGEIARFLSADSPTFSPARPIGEGDKPDSGAASTRKRAARARSAPSQPFLEGKIPNTKNKTPKEADAQETANPHRDLEKFTRPVSEARRAAFCRDVARAEFTRRVLRRASDRLQRASLACVSEKKDKNSPLQGYFPRRIVNEEWPVVGDLSNSSEVAVGKPHLTDGVLNTALNFTGSDIMIGREIARHLQQGATLDESDECFEDFYARREQMCGEEIGYGC